MGRGGDHTADVEAAPSGSDDRWELANAQPPQGEANPQCSAGEEDDDPFGHGGGLDDEDAPRAAADREDDVAGGTAARVNRGCGEPPQETRRCQGVSGPPRGGAPGSSNDHVLRGCDRVHGSHRTDGGHVGQGVHCQDREPRPNADLGAIVRGCDDPHRAQDGLCAPSRARATDHRGDDRSTELVCMPSSCNCLIRSSAPPCPAADAIAPIAKRPRRGACPAARGDGGTDSGTFSSASPSRGCQVGLPRAVLANKDPATLDAAADTTSGDGDAADGQHGRPFGDGDAVPIWMRPPQWLYPPPIVNRAAEEVLAHEAGPGEATARAQRSTEIALVHAGCDRTSDPAAAAVIRGRTTTPGAGSGDLDRADRGTGSWIGELASANGADSGGGAVGRGRGGGGVDGRDAQRRKARLRVAELCREGNSRALEASLATFATTPPPNAWRRSDKELPHDAAPRRPPPQTPPALPPRTWLGTLESNPQRWPP